MPKPNAAYLRSPTIPVAEIDDDMSRSVAAAAKHDADLVGQIERLRAAMLDIAGRMERQADANVTSLHLERPPKFQGDPTLAVITQSHFTDMARELRAAATK